MYGSAVLEQAAERQGDMMDAVSTARLLSTPDRRMTGGLLLADQLAAEIKRQWDQGQPADLVAVLAEHPELLRYRSIVLDLAYEEYCGRRRAGEQLSAGEFSRAIPLAAKVAVPS
jgi:hypothetical protein